MIAPTSSEWPPFGLGASLRSAEGRNTESGPPTPTLPRAPPDLEVALMAAENELGAQRNTAINAKQSILRLRGPVEPSLALRWTTAVAGGLCF